MKKRIALVTGGYTGRNLLIHLKVRRVEKTIDAERL